MQPYLSIISTLAALRAAGHQVVVFTGAAVHGARTLLAAAGVEVDLLVGGDWVDHPKPSPDGLRLTARLLRVLPDRLAYIGDAPTDLEAARAAGAHAVAASWGHLYDPTGSAGRP